MEIIFVFFYVRFQQDFTTVKNKNKIMQSEKITKNQKYLELKYDKMYMIK